MRLDESLTATATTVVCSHDRPVEVRIPPCQKLPFVFASPHSGRDYSPDFLAATRLDPVSLRRSEDSFVDEIFAAACDHGAPLIRATYPRAYCDPNREPYELDPAMFADPLLDFVNTSSVRVASGLGTIARVVATGTEIYAGALRFDEAERRVEQLYRPYHAALAKLIDQTRDGFGAAALIDCHSMPSVGGPMDKDRGRARPDMVLGDRYGTACSRHLIAFVEKVLKNLGYRVARNTPYAGGFTTAHYGRPQGGVHALQIEINRAIYMDETKIQRGPGLPELAKNMGHLIASLKEFKLAGRPA